MQERVWESGWDGHEQAQLRRQAKLPFADKLQWLEEAHHMVLALQKSRAAQRNQSHDAPQVLAEQNKNE